MTWTKSPAKAEHSLSMASRLSAMGGRGDEAGLEDTDDVNDVVEAMMSNLNLSLCGQRLPVVITVTISNLTKPSFE